MTAATEVEGAPVEGRPVPQLDPTTSGFWEATKRGELVVQECTDCKHRQFYPRSICTQCGSANLDWLKTEGKGVIHTFSVVRQSGVFPFNQWTPYAVAMIELDEGPRIMGGVIGIPVDDISIGTRVEVQFVDLNDSSALPFWKPAS